MTPSVIDLVQELVDKNYVKNQIKSIAERHSLTEASLKKIYERCFFKQVFDGIDLKKINEVSINEIERQTNKKNEFKFIKNNLSKIIDKALYLASLNGFPVNINDIESGVMTANAGDSAEFIFVARAILAGFNCSSVDVRSSKYDAIIDFEQTLLRVQIKGISTGTSISFKDRDRGGKGVDHNHERNKGQRITSKDCDIYVAVDKQVGVCYIIPMTYPDGLPDEKFKSVSLNDVKCYRENWDVIKDVCKNKRGCKPN